MNKILLTLALSFLTVPALADYDFGLEVGIRQQSGDSDVDGISTKSQMGLQFGGFVVLPIANAWHIRTGMLYTQRPLIVENDVTGEEAKLTMNYLDVPVALMYKFEEYAGIFAGVSLGLNIDSSSDDKTVAKIEDVKSPIIPLLFGASFKFAPNFGATLYFESAGSEVAKDLKNYRAVGANLQITFD
ncbi:hypothetical protein D3C72_1096780 [compost metagenome]